jgi:hypothetical protein
MTDDASLTELKVVYAYLTMQSAGLHLIDIAVGNHPGTDTLEDVLAADPESADAKQAIDLLDAADGLRQVFPNYSFD